ncbi:MAG: 23S rRNA (uracil(1939)-C(5))-methyltransferase RlmD [Anaerococcus obesiensis]
MREKPIKDVEIIDMSYPNISIGKIDEEKTVQFKGGVLGQKVRVKITKNRGKNKKGKFMEVLEESKIENAKEFCPHAGICGGCSYQKMGYETELLLKHDMIKKLLKNSHIDIADLSIIRSPKIKGYRNKMEYTFGDSYKDGPLVLGLHRQNRFYEIVDTDGCNIVDSDFETIRKYVQKYFREKNTSFYHKKAHTGLLRNLIVRKALHTGEIMVVLVTSSDKSFDPMRRDLFAHNLLNAKTKGRIVSIYHVINDSLSDAVKVDTIELLFGKKYIEEKMNDLKFQISPFSFFQPNVYTAEKIYQKAIELANVDKNKNVLDLYSGTGTITQLFAKFANKAMGIEIIEEAVEKAFDNAKENEIENIDFIAGDVLEKIDLVKGKYDIVVIDPPREGIHPKAIKKIIDIAPEEFVYISCNPKTQVRDLEIFIKNGYKIKKYQAFDQFPRSRHVEAAILMTYCGLDKE